MTPLSQVANVGAAIAFVAFFVALVLTLWPNWIRILAAALLFTMGTWVSLGVLARNYYVLGAGAQGTSDNGSPNIEALCWKLLPIALGIYAIIAPVLLWPSIPQAIAMRYGLILNLTFALLLAMLMLGATYISAQVWMFPDALKWLVYALVWFRIRQSYDLPKQT